MTNPVRSLVDKAVDKARDESRKYSAGDERPLGGYAAGMGVYASAVSGLSLLIKAQHKTLPQVSGYDLFLLTAATHKITRLISKENITSAIRAPFTRYAGTAGPAELHEEVRGHGVRHAAGELLTCPFCLAQWTATAFTFGMIFAPAPTKLVASTMTAVAGSDFLQLAYAWAQSKAA